MEWLRSKSGAQRKTERLERATERRLYNFVNVLWDEIFRMEGSFIPKIKKEKKLRRRFFGILFLFISFGAFGLTKKDFGSIIRSSDKTKINFTYSIDANGNTWIVPVQILVEEIEVAGKTYTLPTQYVSKVEEMAEVLCAFQYKKKWYIGWGSYIIADGGVNKMTAMAVEKIPGDSDQKFLYKLINTVCSFYYLEKYPEIVSREMRAGRIPYFDDGNGLCTIGVTNYLDSSYSKELKEKAMTIRAPYRLDSKYREESSGLDYFSVDLYDRSVIVDVMKRGYYLCENRGCGFPYAGSFNIELQGSHRLEKTGDTSTQRYYIKWLDPNFKYSIPMEVKPLS